MMDSAPIRYPRRRALRVLLRLLGRAAMRLFTRTEVLGRENLPAKGPLILVGNHGAAMEAALMAVYVPWQIEVLGAGEIPLDLRYASIVKAYGYIPIQRGDVDREALNAALGVLRQGGVVGVFPEGGIWEPVKTRPRTGAAWLSYQSGAPLVPIGFGGVRGALGAAFALKRPRLVMNIGPLMPPVTGAGDAVPLRGVLREASQQILTAIESLIPEDDRRRRTRITNERFDLRLTVRRADGGAVAVPDDLAITEGRALSKFLHRPLLLDVLSRNLKLPVRALQRLEREPAAERLSDAVDVVLRYVEETNPHFFSYRFGYAEAAAMTRALWQLRSVAVWAAEHGYRLTIVPVRRYTLRGSDEEVVECRPGELPPL